MQSTFSFLVALYESLGMFLQNAFLKNKIKRKLTLQVTDLSMRQPVKAVSQIRKRKTVSPGFLPNENGHIHARDAFELIPYNAPLDYRGGPLEAFFPPKESFAWENENLDHMFLDQL